METEANRAGNPHPRVESAKLGGLRQHPKCSVWHTECLKLEISLISFFFLLFFLLEEKLEFLFFSAGYRKQALPPSKLQNFSVYKLAINSLKFPTSPYT